MFLRKILFIASAVVYLFVNTDYCLAQHTYDESRPNDSIQNRQLDAVVVTAQSARQRLERIGLGVEYIELATMAKMPMLFGENDIIKSISLLPGVRAEGDGSGGFEVRGGNSAQNLIMLAQPIADVLSAIITVFMAIALHRKLNDMQNKPLQ